MHTAQEKALIKILLFENWPFGQYSFVIIFIQLINTRIFKTELIFVHLYSSSTDSFQTYKIMLELPKKMWGLT